jgi:hypothetical protein
MLPSSSHIQLAHPAHSYTFIADQKHVLDLIADAR